MINWQPIKTAPRDGTTILARLDDGRTVPVKWDTPWLNEEIGTRYAPFCVTHWCPLAPAGAQFSDALALVRDEMGKQRKLRRWGVAVVWFFAITGLASLYLGASYRKAAADYAQAAELTRQSKALLDDQRELVKWRADTLAVMLDLADERICE